MNLVNGTTAPTIDHKCPDKPGGCRYPWPWCDTRPATRCRVDGCDEYPYKVGVCGAHYAAGVDRA